MVRVAQIRALLRAEQQRQLGKAITVVPTFVERIADSDPNILPEDQQKTGREIDPLGLDRDSADVVGTNTRR